MLFRKRFVKRDCRTAIFRISKVEFETKQFYAFMEIKFKTFKAIWHFSHASIPPILFKSSIQTFLKQ